MLGMSERSSVGPKYASGRYYENAEVYQYYYDKFYFDKTIPKMLACDTEDNSKGKTHLVNFFDGVNHFTFDHHAAAMDWLINYSQDHKKGVVVWIANLGYDIGNLFRDDIQEFFSATIAGSRFITAKVYKEKIKFKDILNVIPGASVKKLGKMIGLEKIETNDFNNVKYCQVDTEIVFWAQVVFEKTLRELKVELRNTAAATGFNALLNTYPILTKNNFNDEEHLFMQSGYAGGRTEVFNVAKHTDDIYGYDIVSCYPDAMRTIPLMDVDFRTKTKKPDIQKYEGMVDCTIKVKNIEIPYLPLKFDNKLIFPDGTFRGVWTFFEIREALKLGYEIVKIHEAIQFTRKHNFTMEEFVLKFFKLKSDSKLNNHVVMEYAAKIILNASYGKFAMGREKTSLIGLDELLEKKSTKNFTHVIYPNNQVAIKSDDRYAPTTNFLTAAYITAYSRHNLYQYLLMANAEKRILLYCDTDSVFFKGKPFNEKKLSTGLGSLELQYEIKKCQFVLPKTYMIELNDGRAIYKCKGVWGDLAQKYFTEGFVEKMQPLKYIETCRKNLYIQIRNEKNKTNEPMMPFNVWVNKIKAKNADYNKRRVLNGGMTQPLSLNYNIETSENRF